MVQAGKWDRKNFEGVELYNKTLGIIGMGRIGSELSRRAIAFGMRVRRLRSLSLRDPRALVAGRIGGRTRRSPAAADFITLHTPLTPETHHLLECRATRENKTRRAR